MSVCLVNLLMTFNLIKINSPESSESLTIDERTNEVCSSESPTARNVSSKPFATICLQKMLNYYHWFVMFKSKILIKYREKHLTIFLNLKTLRTNYLHQEKIKTCKNTSCHIHKGFQKQDILPCVHIITFHVFFQFLNRCQIIVPEWFVTVQPVIKSVTWIKKKQKIKHCTQ